MSPSAGGAAETPRRRAGPDEPLTPRTGIQVTRPDRLPAVQSPSVPAGKHARDPLLRPARGGGGRASMPVTTSNFVFLKCGVPPNASKEPHADPVAAVSRCRRRGAPLQGRRTVQSAWRAHQFLSLGCPNLYSSYCGFSGVAARLDGLDAVGSPFLIRLCRSFRPRRPGGVPLTFLPSRTMTTSTSGGAVATAG